MLNAYAPKGLEKLDSRFRDSKAEPHWIGLDAFFSAIEVKTGKTLWTDKQELPAMSVPMTYMYKGKQYVAITARGFNGETVGNVVAYALP